MSTPRVQTASDPSESTSARAVHVVTFGCQMNQYDSLLVEGRFRKKGYRLTGTLEEADVILFNTCSVRDKAEERVYSWVGALKAAKEKRPDLVVGVMGCMAQRAEEEIFERAAHVDLVCGTRQLQNLPELVEEVAAAVDRRLGAGRSDRAVRGASSRRASARSPAGCPRSPRPGCLAPARLSPPARASASGYGSRRRRVAPR